tara:strand:+ start:124 stop:462 length:339 start_codon:yes stop_codon:yes gene_type:complete
MPIKVNKEMRDKLIKLITDNPIIKRNILVDISGVKEWYVGGTLSELMADKTIFKQVKNGRAHYCMMDYAIANNVPARIVDGKESKAWVKVICPEAQIPAQQRMVDKYFQVAR